VTANSFIPVASLFGAMGILFLAQWLFQSQIGISFDINAYITYNAYMKTIQYTIRGIPSSVDQVIRKRAQQEGKSFNQTVVDLLSLQVFGTTEPKEDTNFSWLFNKNSLDEGFDQAIRELSQVDEPLWQ